MSSIGCDNEQVLSFTDVGLKMSSFVICLV